MSFFWISFISSFALCLAVVKKTKIKQQERDFTPTSKTKNASPFGGICMFLAITISFGYYLFLYTPTIIDITTFIFITTSFAIGLLDDIIKIRKIKGRSGLTFYQKVVLQICVATAFSIALYIIDPNFQNIYIPFYHRWVSLSYFAIPIYIIFIFGILNSANVTDGIDGMAGKQALAICVFFCAFIQKILPTFSPDVTSLVIFPMLFSGALIGFLFFNCNTARIFMGDAGSFLIGAIISACFIRSGLILIIPAICFIILCEGFSVILQVASFKFRNGKRIFKMSPIHHHFQLLGFEEQKITEVAFLTTLIICIFGYIYF